MLAKKYRLPASFFTARRRSQRDEYSPLFAIKIFSSANEYNRFGVVVSTKTIPLSSGRVRVRRMVYDSIRRVQAQMEGGCDVVIIAQPGIATVDSSVVERDIIQLSRKAGLIS